MLDLSTKNLKNIKDVRQYVSNNSINIDNTLIKVNNNLYAIINKKVQKGAMHEYNFIKKYLEENKVQYVWFNIRKNGELDDYTNSVKELCLKDLTGLTINAYRDLIKDRVLFVKCNNCGFELKGKNKGIYSIFEEIKRLSTKGNHLSMPKCPYCDNLIEFYSTESLL